MSIKKILASQPREETYPIYLKFLLDIRTLKYGNGRGSTSISVAALRVNLKGNGDKYVGHNFLITATTKTTRMRLRVDR
jgi:hypothetical protein